MSTNVDGLVTALWYAVAALIMLSLDSRGSLGIAVGRMPLLRLGPRDGL